MKEWVEKLDDVLEWGGRKKQMIFLAVSAVSLLLELCDIPLPFAPSWIAIILCGIPIVLEALIGLVTSFDIKADVLVAIALIASLCIGENFAAGEVAFIMQLGELLEDLTVAKAQAGIEKLVRLSPQTARVIRDGKEVVIEAEQVVVGDVLRVLPGETIPADGVILSGATAVDQSVVTGESLPIDKTVGDEVSGGTVNRFGTFEMRATKVGADSTIQRMIQLVRSADAGKAKIVGIADRWATWIVVAALAAAGVTWLVTGAFIRAVTILVVFCPCALVLATPAAIMAAIGNATAHGFLVRQGDALERLSQANTVTFDKTGTLTKGTPQVVTVKSVTDRSDLELYRLTAAAEQYSEHPLGKAIVRSFGEASAEPLPPATEFLMTPGRGVTATVEGKTVQAGSAEILEGTASEVPGVPSEGGTVIYVLVDGEVAGYLVLTDTVRAESSAVVKALRAEKIAPVLLTGDRIGSAEPIARQVGISAVYADCLPEDKLRRIEAIQQEGNRVCMVGDGINDAPALKKADIGIAMGGIGSDIAVEAADIVLVNDDIKELPHLFALSARMMRTIKLNMTFSMTLNFLAILLAITGILNPIAGALVHNAGSIAVVLNSAFLLKWKRR